MLENEQGPFHVETTVKDVTPAEAAWPPPPRPRAPQGPSTATKVSTIILAALLITSGLGFIIYAATNQYGLAVGMQRRLNVNATVRSQIASQATLVSSLQQTAQPLATTQAQILATATATAQGPSSGNQDQATATATALGDMLTQDTTGTPTLDDPLSDPTTDPTKSNTWQVASGDNKNSGCQFTGLSYEVQEARQGFLLPCFALKPSFNNFVYQVSMTINAGSQGGIVFRANPAKGQYYLFRVGIDGSYALELYNGSKYTLLAQGSNSAISTGAGVSNSLTVIANKGTFYLFVNSTYVDSASDTTLSEGQIGVVAINRNLPTTIDFSGAKVWKLA